MKTKTKIYEIEVTNQYKKNLKKAFKRGYNLALLEKVVDMLASGETLPAKYKNHPLKGEYAGFFDCHIQPDWVLIYKIKKEKLVLLLLDTGTHSDLFDK